MPPACLTVIVFARAPVPGRCKTRLMPAYGANGAARLHRQLVHKTLSTACALPGATVELWCEPDIRHGFFARLRREFGVSLRRQHSGDLGRKMALALTAGLAAGAEQVLLIGTDCPALSTDDLSAASESLRRNDVVILPSEDGGYVLIGAQRFGASALRGIDWSSGRELAQTLHRCKHLPLSCGQLPPRWDVDFPADVRRARRLGLLTR